MFNVVCINMALIGESHGRIKRAIANYHVHVEYEHKIVLPEKSRLSWNQAFDWCQEQFGDPGGSWDFYFETKFKRKWNKSPEWVDTFGFSDPGDAAFFVLRWS